jgi:hypothetical protein
MEMHMFRKRYLGHAFAFLALAGVLAVAAPVQAQSSKAGVKAGLLRCNVASGFGLVFGSSKDLKCIYSPAAGGASQRYTGKIQKFGVDIGYTQSGVLVWAVFAPTNDVAGGALQGQYVGGSAEATAGLGLGANALVGGGNSIALQPVSISGQKGLNIAGGIGAVTLQWAR